MIDLRLGNPHREERFKELLKEPFLKENGRYPTIRFGAERPSCIISPERKASSVSKDLAVVSIASRIDPVLERAYNAGSLSAAEWVLLGVSCFEKNQTRFTVSGPVRVFSAREIAFEGLAEVCDAAMASIRASGKPFVLSINLDVLDSAFASCGLPGGLTPRQLLYLVQRFRLLHHFHHAELLGVDESTMKLAAKLAIELC